MSLCLFCMWDNLLCSVQPAFLLSEHGGRAQQPCGCFYDGCASKVTFFYHSFQSSPARRFTFVFHCRLKTLGCMNLDDLSQFDSQLQLSIAAWGYYYEDYIRLSTGIKILQTSRRTRDQDYEIRLVHSLAERRLNEKWSIGEFLIISCLLLAKKKPAADHYKV